MDFSEELDSSLKYLASDLALDGVALDAYWPKWDSPWWHMLLLHEMGLTHEIPRRLVSAFVEKVSQYPVQIFPIRLGDMPEGVDPFRGTPCHCQLGNVYQVLFACGINVDQELPWIRPWFLRYQMSDGGLNCDNDAYLVENEVASSMVGTIAVFESVLRCTKRPWTAEETLFLKKGADFLIRRQLRLGSSTQYNTSERESAKKWTELCFPRYYFYDVLRGLSALTEWAEKTKTILPREAYQSVVELLESRFPLGEVKIGRLAYEGCRTIAPTATGEWTRVEASFFSLLKKVSTVGEVSPFLSKQWAAAKQHLEHS